MKAHRLVGLFPSTLQSGDQERSQPSKFEVRFWVQEEIEREESLPLPPSLRREIFYHKPPSIALFPFPEPNRPTKSKLWT